MKKCWACRRRRLKCDGAVPHCNKCEANGQECPGYVKPLTWVNGVASRGQLRNRSLSDVYPAAPEEDCCARYQGRLSPSSGSVTTLSDPFSTCSKVFSASSDVFSVLDEDVKSETELSLTSSPGLSRALTEPLFQDLGGNARFLIHHCMSPALPRLFNYFFYHGHLQGVRT